jgi:mannose/cellobiose epimerase-like protein (N-acyl-D-glucosamine 2-epimerase family)
LRERYTQDDGTVIASVGQDGGIFNETFDLYNQAFALLDSLDPTGGWQSRARALIGILKREVAHPVGGFREDHDGRPLTLRSNPHVGPLG